MPAILLFLLVVILVGGLGFVVKALFWLAIILFVAWLVGFKARPAGRRWYYW